MPTRYVAHISPYMLIMPRHGVFIVILSLSFAACLAFADPVTRGALRERKWCREKEEQVVQVRGEDGLLIKQARQMRERTPREVQAQPDAQQARAETKTVRAAKMLQRGGA